jgi:RNA polymerase sigma-70 factor (ECF subfamily)
MLDYRATTSSRPGVPPAMEEDPLRATPPTIAGRPRRLARGAESADSVGVFLPISRSSAASDVELLYRLQQGDKFAIGVLYNRYAHLLWLRALCILRDRAEAEDIVHDMFVVVSDRASQYVSKQGAVAAWLVTLVRNLSIDRRRRRDRRGSIVTEVLSHEPADKVADPESLLSRAVERNKLRLALQGLSAAHRRTLETAFFDGLNYSEIAEREGLPLGTVKSRAARALASLRDACARQGHASRAT